MAKDRHDTKQPYAIGLKNGALFAFAGLWEQRQDYKHRDPAQLLEAIRTISKGELWLDSSAIRSLIASAKERAPEERRRSSLSLRQQQVPSGVLDGLSNKAIAWRVQVSTSTTKAIVQELFERAGVRRRSQLVRAALQEHEADWSAGDRCLGSGR